MTHDFRQSLAYSHSMSDQPWWGEIYRAAFGEAVVMVDVRNDGWAQRAGIDRTLILPCAKTLYVDEKVRTKDYGDILLEFYSDFDRKTLGWIAKPAASDYIAYAIEPAKTCYLLPFQELRRAWRTHHKRWVDTYGHRDARNKTWTTRSCPVPTTELLEAISEAVTVQWSHTDVTA